MADWDVASAVSSLRSLLGDGVTDKYEFKTDVFPTPDGVTRRFFVGETRLVPDTLEVYEASVEVAVSGTPDYVKGSFDLAVAPSGNTSLTASFYFQWFTDAELQSFMDTSTNILGFTDITDPALVSGIRTVIMHFAAYNAYMRKAAEHADSVVATAAGYTADQSRSHPNWRELAKTALATAKELLDYYVNNPLTGANLPRLLFVRYTMQRYQPL